VSRHRLAPNKARLWRTDRGIYLDVRGLECPEPLVSVLQVIDRGDAPDVLTVHLDQEPFLLYPELASRGWSHELVHASPGDPLPDNGVVLMIVRKRI